MIALGQNICTVDVRKPTASSLSRIHDPVTPYIHIELNSFMHRAGGGGHMFMDDMLLVRGVTSASLISSPLHHEQTVAHFLLCCDREMK